MAFETRGGQARVFRDAAVPTTGRDRRPPSITKFIQLSNEGANVLRLYFTEEDFDADANYVELVATSGFFEGPVETDRYFLRAVTAPTAVVVVEYYRRG